MTTTLGVTFACFRGLGPRFEVATTDEQIVRDEVFHRLTTDSVLGESDEAASFGYDVRQRLGARMTDDDVMALGPLLSAVLQRSGRIETADVKCARTPNDNGLLVLGIGVTVTIVTGDTFSFLFLLTGSTFEQVGVVGST
jgi:hypothetical protein